MLSLPISFREIFDSAIRELNQDNIHNQNERESDSDVSNIYFPLYFFEETVVLNVSC